VSEGKPLLNRERCGRDSAAFCGNRPAVPQNLIGSDETHSPSEVQQRDMADDRRSEFWRTGFGSTDRGGDRGAEILCAGVAAEVGGAGAAFGEDLGDGALDG
jgi:hypothetical protein